MLTLPSFAKINWMLRVLGKRDDGYHEIFTVIQTISLHDTIAFEEDTSLELTCNNRHIPIGRGNLIIKAAKALRLHTGVNKGARMLLEKRIPSPGGLGGGSSNAAVTLIGLSKLWGIDVSRDDLRAIAADLGSDVPFFLTGGTAIATGRGETIDPIGDITEENMLVVTPRLRVSTRDAYAGLSAARLTKEGQKRILRVCRLEAGSLDLHQSVLKNDFEANLFSAHPEIRKVKETLLELGAFNAAMSGSGASVYAVFDKKETRQAAIEALGHEPTWRKFVVATISRSEYREALRC
jgi:4-diphosphocytidyl-2-C-methyl-D-erythritol kinase